MVRSRSEIGLSVAALSLSLAFFFGTILIPLSSIVFQFESFADFFQTFFAPTTLGPLRMSVIQSFISTTLSLGLGGVLGFYLFRSSPKSFWIEWILSIPYTVPTLVVALSWVSILGVQGTLGFLNIGYSLTAVIIAHSVLNIPLMALATYHSLLLTPADEIACARTMSPSKGSLLRHYWIPRLSSQILLTGTQIFSLCMTSFIIVLILGGGPPVETLETGIFSRIRYGNPQWASASALALWQILICSSPLILSLFLNRRRRIETPASTAETIKVKALPLVLSLAFLAVYIAPYLNLEFWSQLSHIIGSMEFWDPVLSALATSFSLAGLSTILGLVLLLSSLLTHASFPKMRPMINLMAQIPSGISVLVLCLGLYSAYGSWVDPFEGKLFLIALVQAAFLLPFMFRTLQSSSGNANLDSLLEARSLGATFLGTLSEIFWPTFKRPLLMIVAISFATSISEVAAVSFFYSDDFVPLSLLMSRWMSQYRFAEAQILGLALLAISILVTSSNLSLQFHFKKGGTFS